MAVRMLALALGVPMLGTPLSAQLQAAPPLATGVVISVEAGRSPVSETGGTLLTIANDGKIQLEFDPTTVAGDRLSGDEGRLLTQLVMDRPVEVTGETRWTAAVTGFGMLLGDSEHAGDFGWADVLELARGARGADPNGYRGEFLRLVEIAGTLPVPTDDRTGLRR